jgi:hypothetical protein
MLLLLLVGLLLLLLLLVLHLHSGTAGARKQLDMVAQLMVLLLLEAPWSKFPIKTHEKRIKAKKLIVIRHTLTKQSN